MKTNGIVYGGCFKSESNYCISDKYAKTLNHLEYTMVSFRLIKF